MIPPAYTTPALRNPRTSHETTSRAHVIGLISDRCFGRMAQRPLPTRRRTVAARVLVSYALITLCFALVAGWSVVAQRKAARDADLVRTGYLPLSLALRDLVARQDTWNTQLNHITTARNPADKRLWFETTLRVGRPKLYGAVRDAIRRAFVRSPDAGTQAAGQQFLQETSAIESFVQEDGRLVTRLFEALEQGNQARAEKLRDSLVTRGSQAQRRIGELEESVERNIDALFAASRARERLALQLLAGLALLTLVVGIAMAFHARRVLRPLTTVTRRAEAVAKGDLTPHDVVASNDEIGELAATFESMVSAIARANEQLLSSERLATIGKMAAHVTHEIRNPLSSLGLNVELLEEELDPSALEARNLVRAIKEEIDRLSALSSQYLSMARRQPPQLEYEKVAELAAEACDFMRKDLERHGVTVGLDGAEDLPQVPVDEAQLKQALYNLIRNAREAMPGGGHISVVVGRVDTDRVAITVNDEGPGMSEATRAKLFEPFFTTKGRGTGLGLAITRQIVKAHGGHIACESREGKGTSFRIELPVSSPAAESPMAAPAVQRP